MKINKLMLALLAGAMFASCSDDRVDGPDSPAGGDAERSSGYLSVAIGLPSEATSRGLNDKFDDGLDEEWTVSNAAVIFFEGNLPNPEFVRVFPISTSFDFADGTNDANVEGKYDQLTASIAATFPVSFAKESNAPLYALAILNYSNVFAVTQTADEKDWILTTTADNKVVSKGTTFPEFMKLTTNRDLKNGSKDFFMVNTPYSRVPGSTIKPEFFDRDNSFQVLAEVLRQNIFETAAQAKANPAAEIFVERALAKVEVQPTVALDNIANKLGVKVESMTWIIDNTEPSTFIIRNLETVGGTSLDGKTTNYLPSMIPSWAEYVNANADSKNYRFIGSIPLKDLSRYRTYFCVNPDGKNGNGYNYDDYATLNADGTYTVNSPMVNAYETTDPKNYGSTDKPQYCYENTFDVEHMDYFNTTRAIIKVKFAGIGEGENTNRPFYTVGLDQTTRYIFDDAASIVTRTILENSNARDAWEAYFETVQGAVNVTATTADMVYGSNALSQGTAENSWMKVTLNNESGRLLVTELELRDGTGTGKDAVSIKASKEVLDKIMKEVNETNTIKTYINSEGYFAVRIKHFGDTYTKWEEPTANGKPITTNSTSDSYNNSKPWGSEADYVTAANTYLGRYGVVRNNWYVVQVSAINTFGEPTAGDLPLDKTPDDKTNIEEAIACRINILSWAKRVQSEEL